MASDLEQARKLLGPKRDDERPKEYESRVELIAAALRKERKTGEQAGMLRAILTLRKDMDALRKGDTDDRPERAPATT